MLDTVFDNVTPSSTYTPVNVPSRPLSEISLFVNSKPNEAFEADVFPSEETPPLASPSLPIPLNDWKLFPLIVLPSIIWLATCQS